MKTRVITGAVLALVFVPLFVIGGIVLDVLLGVLSAAATYEIVKMFNIKRDVPFYLIVVEVLFSVILYTGLITYFQGTLDLEFVFVFVFFMVIVGAMFTVFEENFHTGDLGNLLLAVLYPAFGFAAISYLRFLDLHNIGFLFTITIFTDVFAYIVGVNFGKHRLAVKISPKKSIEGSIGGTFFALVFSLVYIFAFEVEMIGTIEMGLFVSILLIVVLSAIGQIGDLIASKFKRDYGVKDYSNIFPGHGGVMDRFDSVLFAGMVLVFISKVVGIV